MKSFGKLREACWKGYKAVGNKKKGDKLVPNCVPEEVELQEKVDKKDTVTVDIPLLIRLLEHAREDIKSDMDLHRVVEKLISIRNKGVLTMDDYDTIVAIKEEVELDETSQKKAGEYLQAVTKQQVNKIGIQPNMYEKLPKNRQKGVANAFKRLQVKEDGGVGVGALAVPGPTNKTGPQSATDPVSATAVNMQKKKRFATIRRSPPKM